MCLSAPRIRFRRESPDGVPRLEQFAASHPSVAAAFASAGTPDRFAHEVYRGLNTFVFVDKAGNRQAVRYVTTPEELVYLTPDEAARQPPEFLVDDLPQRIARRPVVFHLKAQLAAPGDQTQDPSQPWPDNRPLVDLGVLRLDTPVPDTLQVQKNLLFLPINLPDGIELSDDKLPVIRSKVYGLAFARRSA